MERVLDREIITNKIFCRFLAVTVFIALTALGAFVRIPLPFTPVPLTLQTFFVLLSGAFLGAGLGLTVQASYLLLGVLGVPLFSGSSAGLAYLFGPSAGYLCGFLIAAFFLGRALGNNKQVLISNFVLFCVADAIILLSGAIWLKFILGISFTQALYLGFLPFIPGDLMKLSLAVFIYSKINPRLKEAL